jgi:hypothetical protein
MSTQYRLVQSGKTASGGCSAGQGSSEPVAPRIYFIFFMFYLHKFSIEILLSVVNVTGFPSFCFKAIKQLNEIHVLKMCN